MDVLLVLRRKRNTDPHRVQALVDQGLDVRVVPGWSHFATIVALRQLARQYHPDILVAHGFSEHLWGRYAGLLAKVPHLVHVEHNSRERYSGWQLWQAKWLAGRTDAIVGVSEGVRDALLQRGFPADRCIAIPNGIELGRFDSADQSPWVKRSAGVIMASRFARQKDQGTLVKAIQLLKLQDIHLPLAFAGLGKSRLMKRTLQQVRDAGLQDQVQFMGHVQGLHKTLMRYQFFVLSTHYEGMPLALVEAMAAGCACVATDVVGVRGVIEDEINGLLVPENDAPALAAALLRLIRNPEWAQRLGSNARRKAYESYSLRKMHQQYESLLLDLSRQNHIDQSIKD